MRLPGAVDRSGSLSYSTGGVEKCRIRCADDGMNVLQWIARVDKFRLTGILFICRERNVYC